MLCALIIAHKIYSLFIWCRQPLTAEILGNTHKWVNLDVTYVDAETGVHTNRIESRLVCNFIVSLSLKYVLSINNEICTVSPHFSEQVNFSFLLIFLVCSLLLWFYMLSFWETFPFPQLPCPLHVEADCKAKGQGHVQWNAIHPVHETTAEWQRTSWHTGD